MITIYNRKNYTQYISVVTLILIIGLAISFTFKRGNILLLMGLFIFFELIFLSKRFTYEISIPENKIQIVYYKWGLKKWIEFDLNNIRIEIKNIVSNRGYKAKMLNIFLNDKLEYAISTDDGFGEDDFDTIETAFLKNKTL